MKKVFSFLLLLSALGSISQAWGMDTSCDPYGNPSKTFCGYCKEGYCSYCGAGYYKKESGCNHCTGNLCPECVKPAALKAAAARQAAQEHDRRERDKAEFWERYGPEILRANFERAANNRFAFYKAQESKAEEEKRRLQIQLKNLGEHDLATLLELLPAVSSTYSYSDAIRERNSVAANPTKMIAFKNKILQMVQPTSVGLSRKKIEEIGKKYEYDAKEKLNFMINLMMLED